MNEFLVKLAEETATQLKQVLQFKTFDKGESIFIQGASSEAIYFIVEGRIKISRVTYDGNEIILCMRTSGDIFCPVPVLDTGKQLGSAIAMTDGTLYWVEKDVFTELCAKYPDLLALVQGDCLFEVRRLLGRMESYAYRSIRERLAQALLEVMEHKENQDILGNTIRMKQADLAGIVGSSRESVSRTLSQFEDQGILKTSRGHIQIIDKEKLALIANLL